MYIDAKHHWVRQEQNQALLQEAAFERWLNKIQPQAPEKEPLLTELTRWLDTWRASLQKPLPCLELAPACTL